MKVISGDRNGCGREISQCLLNTESPKRQGGVHHSFVLVPENLNNSFNGENP